jgi:hypothetical protein
MGGLGSPNECVSLNLESRMPVSDPRPFRRPLAVGRLALAVAAVAALAACNQPENFAPPCPQLAILSDGADINRTVGSGRDITDLVLDAHIVSVPASCQWTDKTHARVTATLNVQMSFARGPAMPGRTVNVPYFVAVSDGQEQVLDKEVYVGQVVFPANSDRVNVSTPPITMVIPVTAQKSAAAYRISVAFQLSEEELRVNQMRSNH